jgi:GT2 family glycosyltransferase
MPQIVAAFDRHPGAGIVAGSLVKPTPGPGRFKVCPEMIPLEVLHDPAVTGSEAPEGFGWAGANMIVRRRVVDDVGPWDELLGPGTRFASTEDTDYIIRAEAAGTCMYSTPDVVMHHTHGYRYGSRAAYRLLRNYAVGNGALAAKLTLLGDPRGRTWMRNELQVALVEPIKRLRPQWLPRRLVRLGYYAAAYRSCRRTCSVSDREIASAVLTPAVVRAR